jgi:hypothetical protein
VPLEALQGIAAVATGGDLEALKNQGIADGFADGVVVFDDEQGGRHQPILRADGLLPEI